MRRNCWVCMYTGIVNKQKHVMVQLIKKALISIGMKANKCKLNILISAAFYDPLNAKHKYKATKIHCEIKIKPALLHLQALQLPFRLRILQNRV